MQSLAHYGDGITIKADSLVRFASLRGMVFEMGRPTKRL